MSDQSRQRFIRAVRLLPGVVRVGKGFVEELQPDAEGKASEKAGSSEDEELSALVQLEAENRKLKSELRGRESELTEARASLRKLRSKMDAFKTALEREKTDFYENAKKEATAAKEEAAREGHGEGYAKGHADGMLQSEKEVRAEYETKFSSVLALFSNVNDSLQKARDSLAKAHAPQLIRLWESMLQRMLRVQVDLDPTVVEKLLEYVLQRVSDREKIIVYLNSLDVAMVEGIKDSIMDSIRGVKFFELLSDDHVDRGSCLIETNLGIYDARWKTQLEQISTEVQGLLEQGMASHGGNGDAG